MSKNKNTPIEAEDIPDEDLLYHRIHKNLLINCKDNEIPAGAIRNTGFCNPPGMSTDWSKYSTPTQTKDRGPQDPEKYKVISMPVGDVRIISEQSVEHTPTINNPAHSTIFGPKDSSHPEIRIKFTRIATLLVD